MENPLSSDNQQKKIDELEAQMKSLQSQIDSEKTKYIKEEQPIQPTRPTQTDFDRNMDELRKPLPKLKSLHKWRSIARPFVKRDRKYFVKVAFVVLVCIMLAAFLQDLALIFVLCAIMFAVYVLGTVKPNEVEHEVSTRGIRTLDKTYNWEELQKFWFTIKHGYIIMNLSTKLRFPTKLSIVLEKGDEIKLVNIVSGYLDYFDTDKQGWLNKQSDGTFLRLVTDGEDYYLEELLSRSDKKKEKVPFREKVVPS